MPDPVDNPTSPEPTPPADTQPASLIGEATTPPAPTENDKPAGEPPKPADSAKPEGEAPKPIADLKAEDFKIPEGMTLDPAKFDNLKTLATDLKIDQPGMQKLLDMHTAELKEASMASTNMYLELQKQWATEASKDAEFGGAKLPETKANIAKSIEMFSKTPQEAEALRQALTLTGAGNNPHIVRFWARAAKALTEGRTVTGGPAAAPRSAAQTLYPDLPSGEA